MELYDNRVVGIWSYFQINIVVEAGCGTQKSRFGLIVVAVPDHQTANKERPTGADAIYISDNTRLVSILSWLRLLSLGVSKFKLKLALDIKINVGGIQ